MEVSIGNKQLTPHPLREGILEGEDLNSYLPPARLSVSNTAERLSHHLIAIAAQNKTTAERLAAWVEAIKRARGQLSVSTFQLLAEQNSLDSIEATVHDFLKLAELHRAGQSLPTTVDVGYGVVVGTLTSIAVHASHVADYLGSAPEIGAVAGVAAMLNRMRTTEKTADKIIELTQANLLLSGAGIVKRNWSENGIQVSYC